jgi:signal recognition particle subunit SEC65
MWDEGEEPASSDKDWAKLSAMERKAGEMLGYDEVRCIVCVYAFRNARLTTRNCFASMQIMWDDHDSKETEGASTYDDYDWHELPVEVQKAARVLGYTSSMWDSDKEPKTCEKDWGRLTSEERESASKLGYDQSKWEGGKDSGRYGENDGPTKARTKVTESTSVSYNDLDWDDLPADVQKAAKILGYTARMWDDDREPKSSDKDWKELTAAEQEAAEKLGHNQLEWDSDGDSAPVVHYNDLTWRKLPVDAQEAAEVLGYTPKMWNNDQEPDTCDKDWNELTLKEREAALKLGYDKKKWKDESEGKELGCDENSRNDGGSDNNAADKSASKALSHPSSSKLWDDFDWDELPDDIKKAARVLGFTAKIWDTNKEPKSSDKDWKELTAAEQEAAEKLGHNQLEWDSDGDSAPVVNYDDSTWRKLHVDAQEAAKVLGYTPKMWNNDQEPDTCDKDWDDLTSKEQEAALKLGYDKKRWENGYIGKNNDDLKWHMLPVGVKEAAKVLGYTPEMWYRDHDPDTCDKLWGELSSDEREAATRLGYTKIKWNGESKSHATTSMVKKEAASVLEGTSGGESDGANANVDSDENHATNSDDYTWRKLPAAIQEAATTIGYTPRLWNKNQEPSTCNKNWRDLTSDERKAAKILGYNELKWEGDSEFS